MWFYCAMDASVTHEVFGQIEPQLGDFTRETYEMARALQAPVLEMMMQGIRIDEFARGRLIKDLWANKVKLEARLKRLIFEGLELTLEEHPWLEEWNPRSINPPTDANPVGGDVQRLLYDVLKLPPVLAHNRKPSVDRDALERLSRYPDAKPICDILIALRDVDKTLGDLKMEADNDKRIRTTLSIAATRTGRMASYTASSGKGRNLQNIPEEYRHIFISDTGYKFAYIDKAQAEARAVAAIIWTLFGDSTYLDACESDDLHTSVAKLVWPGLINSRADADELYYRNFSYRFMCKRIAHGTSYYGTPRTISEETNVPIKQIEEFQEKFFAAFPGISKWHKWVAQQIAAQGFLVSMCGRKRWFMGRPDEDSTLREAIAFDPQETVASLLNRGLFRLWYCSKLDPEAFPVKLNLQVHDAVLLQYPETSNEQTLIPRLCSTIETPLTLRHADKTRRLLIPCEAKIGWNWGEEHDGNKDGLIEFSGKPDTRRRAFDPVEGIEGLGQWIL